VELWFNRTFGHSESGSWTRPMRPDLSLWIGPAPDNPAPFEPVWIHFDAKYRVEALSSLFGGTDENELTREQEAENRGQTLRADLLKMHAYRDAIRRSAGAYVIYPGTEPERQRLYHEILPGLGAFPLRPRENGDPTGTALLSTFIDDVLTHVASQATQHERLRYWEQQATRSANKVAVAVQAVPFLEKPPADTLVLLGFVRTPTHLSWIERERLYPLRADGRTGSVGLESAELSAALLLLYGPSLAEPILYRVSGAPQLHTRSSMLALGYPNPGERYLCLCLEARLGTVPLSRVAIDALRNRLKPGSFRVAPVVATWQQVALVGGAVVP
jgi:hypothetical protein